MGRRPLLSLLASAALGCAGPGGARAPADSPHGNLSCVECHQGELSDRPLADVPPSACLASGCHQDEGPARVSLATVGFDHRGHGETGPIAIGCAGCHTHGSGSEPLRAGPETCGLCHAQELSGARVEDCRTCHGTPQHVGVTSQRVEVPHQGLPWIEGGCLRCHYAVARPVHEVNPGRCAACHEDLGGATRAGIGTDLHPAHTGTGCGACHEEDNHRIEAMSSAVDLQCAHCHAREHGVGPEVADPGTCNACHQGVHEAPQRLLLGILPAETGSSPSGHFMSGLTCRSCHVPGRSGENERRRGDPAACVHCHRPEYATVLRWWEQGVGERLALVDRYLSGAEAATGGGAEAGDGELSRARRLLGLVAAGGQHNLTLTHRIFEDVVAAATRAYGLAGQSAPPSPQLGRLPREGTCSYCHYARSQSEFSEAMDDAFHREVLGSGRGG